MTEIGKAIYSARFWLLCENALHLHLDQIRCNVGFSKTKMKWPVLRALLGVMDTISQDITMLNGSLDSINFSRDE